MFIVFPKQIFEGIKTYHDKHYGELTYTMVGTIIYSHNNVYEELFFYALSILYYIIIYLIYLLLIKIYYYRLIINNPHY